MYAPNEKTSPLQKSLGLKQVLDTEEKSRIGHVVQVNSGQLFSRNTTAVVCGPEVLERAWGLSGASGSQGGRKVWTGLSRRHHCLTQRADKHASCFPRASLSVVTGVVHREQVMWTPRRLCPIINDKLISLLPDFTPVVVNRLPRLC